MMHFVWTAWLDCRHGLLVAVSWCARHLRDRQAWRRSSQPGPRPLWATARRSRTRSRLYGRRRCSARYPCEDRLFPTNPPMAGCPVLRWTMSTKPLSMSRLGPTVWSIPKNWRNCPTDCCCPQTRTRRNSTNPTMTSWMTRRRPMAPPGPPPASSLPQIPLRAQPLTPRPGRHA